jgi:heat shock protein HspQ
MDFARAIPNDVQITPPGRSSLPLTVMPERLAKFSIGQVVRHRRYPFRGVIFDIDPTFANTEEWWLSIPEEVRPKKDQPFYHLLAENAETEYVAYVSEQNLVPDNSGEPVRHPHINEVFIRDKDGSYRMRPERQH